MQRASSSFREPGVSSACWQQRTYPRTPAAPRKLGRQGLEALCAVPGRYFVYDH